MPKQVRVVLSDTAYRKLIAIKGYASSLDGHQADMGQAVDMAIHRAWIELADNGSVPHIQELADD